MKIHDISRLIHPSIAVWPGDTPFERTDTLRLADGASVNLSSARLSLHTGTHADAPWHFIREGSSIEQAELSRFWGRAQVVTVRAWPAIQASHVEPFLKSGVARLLVRANPEIQDNTFVEDFVYFQEGAAALIAASGVQLIGTDGPSVDAFDSRALPAHHAFGRQNVAILENLDLRNVSDGEYELVALPLRIFRGDGSPVRAVLREL
ncbi:MAG TPA: cyclase family protein [Acidobacteriota bacterium]|jgi:arylformamidase